MKTRRIIYLAAALVLLAFLAGLANLFQLRLASGDMYPPYSSLRADPLGAKGLYESLEHLPHLRVRRNYLPLAQQPPSRETSWLVLGVSLREFEWDWAAHRKLLEALAADHGRLVVAFHTEHQPTGGRTNFWGTRPGNPKFGPDKPPLPLTTAWGFELAHVALPRQEDQYQPVTVRGRGQAGLPDQLDWHTSLCFTNVSPAWRIIYARGPNPVVMERDLGGGTLVLVSDSFLFSNEALRFERQSALLAWLLGRNYSVVFDETHLGVAEEPGVGALLRRYRLHGVLAAGILLAALYAWKNARSLAPPVDELEAAGVVAGRDSAGGFINLLRRSIAPRELPRLCLEEWKSKVVRGAKNQGDRLARLEAVVAQEAETLAVSRNPAAAYRRLAEIAAEKKLKTTKP